MKRYGFGVDLGGTTCKLGLMELSGIVLDKWEITTNTSENGKFILSEIAAEIEEKLNERKIHKDEVLGVGIGVPGPVINDSIVNCCMNLGWGIVNVAEEMNKLTGLNIKVANDANLAALGEMWKGGAEGCKNIVMITLGTGVGAGIIINGTIVSGSAGGAGEIGHITVNPNESVHCSCGKRGCFEQYVSATGIARMAKEKLKYNSKSMLSHMKKLTAKEVFDAAKAGDKFASDIVNQVGEILGSTLAAIACTLNPDAFVIGGGVSKAGRIIIDVIEESFRKQVFHACKNAGIELAKLGNDAGIYGGVRLLMQ